jgi:hypothetical protein
MFSFTVNYSKDGVKSNVFLVYLVFLVFLVWN